MSDKWEFSVHDDYQATLPLRLAKVKNLSCPENAGTAYVRISSSANNSILFHKNKLIAKANYLGREMSWPTIFSVHPHGNSSSFSPQKTRNIYLTQSGPEQRNVSFSKCENSEFHREPCSLQ